jgi:AraC-like DNA-binding protein
MYVYLGKLAKAKEAYKQSEKLKNPSDVVDKFMGGYLGGLINSLEGNYSAAVSQFRSLVSYAKEHQLPSYLCFAYQELYHSYNVMEVNDSTLKYMLLCNSTAHRYKLDHIFVETLKDLAFFYEKSGDLEKANRCKSRYIYLNDSIYNLRDFNSVTNTLFTYEVNKATQEIHELKQREEDKTRTIHRQHVTMALVGGGALVLSVLLLIVFRQKRNLDRSYSNLYKLNQTLMESQKDAAKSLRWQNNPSSASLSEIAELKVDNSHSTKYKSGNLSDAQHQFLAKAIEEVMEREEEYCSPDFTLDKLSSLVGSNSTYVSQVINDTFHKSFNNFINTYRIRLACERIADRAHYGNYTLKAIGEGVGFKSYTSFVNIFKDVTGMLPSVYQKMSRKEKPN